MKAQYAQAFLASLESGMAVDTAIAGLKKSLEKKNHTKLLGAVLLEAARVLEAAPQGNQAVVAVATAGDIAALKASIAAALEELGVTKETEVKEVVDETLIGGFVATYNHKEHDASYKKSLKSLYESIVK